MHYIFFLPTRFQLAVTALLAIVPFISATSSPSKPSRRGLDSVNQQRDAGSLRTRWPGWALKSCMTDDPNQPTLTAGGSFTDAVMTVDICVSTCARSYLGLAGLSNGNTCSCGNVTTPGATTSPNCNTKCVGSPETCGGTNAISLYWNGVSQPEPIVVTTVGLWILEGCYSDSSSARTLASPMRFSDGGKSLTIERCLLACYTRGHIYAGVEFANECWCGGSINPTAKKLDQPSCSVLACSGSQRQYCGKSQGMIIYVRGHED